MKALAVLSLTAGFLSIGAMPALAAHDVHLALMALIASLAFFYGAMLAGERA